jgi:hypothetical protein
LRMSVMNMSNPPVLRSAVPATSSSVDLLMEDICAMQHA